MCFNYKALPGPCTVQATVMDLRPLKINFTLCDPMGHVSDFKLIRAYATIDLSLKALKMYDFYSSSYFFGVGLEQLQKLTSVEVHQWGRVAPCLMLLFYRLALFNYHTEAIAVSAWENKISWLWNRMEQVMKAQTFSVKWKSLLSDWVGEKALLFSNTSVALEDVLHTRLITHKCYFLSF